MRHRWEQSEKQMVDTDNEAKTLKAKHQITERHRRERKGKKRIQKHEISKQEPKLQHKKINKKKIPGRDNERKLLRSVYNTV